MVKQRVLKSILKHLLITLLIFWSVPVLATTFAVTKTADTSDGTCDADCSLREAITAANADNSTPHMINFNIPGSDGNCDGVTNVCTISPTSALPTVIKAMTINGYSQPYATAGTNDFPSAINASIKIQIDGASAANGTDGITVNVANVTIKGLAIYGFKDAVNTYTAHGIVALNNAGVTNLKVQGCYIGIKADGTTISKNQGNGIMTSGANNLSAVIGTDSNGSGDAGERNLVSGNDNYGLSIGGTATIMGNFIGTDADGTSDKGNRLVGLVVAGTSTVGTNGDGTNDSAEGNLISGNGTSGIRFMGGNNQVAAGNIIGLDRTGNSKGTVDVTNGSAGIWFSAATTGNRVGSNNDGTSDTIERNIIANNGQSNIEISGGAVVTIRNNYLGLSANGTTVFGSGYGAGNPYDNICIGYCPFATTGTQSTGSTIDNNYIVGQTTGSGINFIGSGSHTVTSNYIGVKVDGTAAGNGNQGILMTNVTSTDAVPVTYYSANNVIGGSTTGLGNTIKNNGNTAGEYGIKIIGVNSDGNLIRKNIFGSNNSGDIYLNGDGSNNDKAAPTLSSVVANGSSLTLSGTSGNSNTIQIYKISGATNELTTYITEVTADGSGNWTATLSSPYNATNTTLRALAVDSSNNTSAASGTYTVINVTPVATAQTASGNEDTNLTVALAGTDGNGDALTYKITTLPLAGSLYQTADGTTLGAQITSVPTTVTDTSARVIFVPTANGNGNGYGNFGFKANDGTVDSTEAAVAVNISAANDAPVAAAQTPSVNQDTALSLTLSAADAENDTLTYSIVTTPSHGTLSGLNSSTGAVVYTPNAAYSGADSFTFKANDGATDGNTATVSITVNAFVRTVIFSSASQSAAESGNMTATINLSSASAYNVIIPFTVSGTATGSGTDYTVTASPATIPAGSTSTAITISVVNDTLDEADETVILTMGTPTNATPGMTALHSATISDNDASPSLSINDVAVTEAEGGVTATYTVTLSAVSGRSVSVDYATTSGTAASGTDFTAVSGTLTFNPGQTSKAINVIVLDDSADEDDETYTVNLSHASNASLSDSSGSGTIRDNDSANSLTVSAGSDFQAVAGKSAKLYGLASVEDGESLTYEWTQISGTSVSLTDPNSALTYFTAPSEAGATLVLN